MSPAWGRESAPACAAASTSGWAARAWPASMARRASASEVPLERANARSAWRPARPVGPRRAMRAAISEARVAATFSTFPAAWSAPASSAGGRVSTSKPAAKAEMAFSSSPRASHIGPLLSSQWT